MAHLFPGFLGQDSRRKTPGMRTTKGDLTWGWAKGLPAMAIRPRKLHQVKCRRAAAEQTKRHRQGLAMTGNEHWLVDAGARAKLLGEVEVPDLDHSPC